MDDGRDGGGMVVTRFAPSPTGHLHIGGARTALFCWALARRARREGREARFLLRIEDTDAARSSESAARGILEDLVWLGLDWDEGPAFGGFGGDPRGVGPFEQSARADVYRAFFERLIDAGLAYPAFDTPEELAAMRKAAEAEKRTFVYRRAPGEEPAAALSRAASEPHVLRFAMPPGPVTVVDEVLGEVTFPLDELDDFVIRKADGMPTYHFAVVVDDALMGVTHVLRGQEHLNNTPKHVALQRALGFATPVYAHMPLIFNVDGTKMSKRDKDKAAKKAARDAGIGDAGALRETGRLAGRGAAGLPDDAAFASWLKDKSRQLPREQVGAVAAALGLTLPEIDVEDFRAAGYLPGVVCNFIALLGWNPGDNVERFDAAFLAGRFGIDRIGKSNAKFDREKLLAFNADTIQHGMSDEAFGAEWLAWAERFDTELAGWARADEDRWRLAAEAARPRSRTLREGRAAIAFALAGDDTIAYDEKAVKKGLVKGEPSGLALLAETSAVLSVVEPWEPTAIEAALGGFVEARGIGLGKAAAPLRVALTGGAVSPPLGLTLGLLERSSALARIDRCLSEHAAGTSPPAEP